MRGYKVSASSERREGVEEVYIFMKLDHSARNLKDSPICTFGEAFLKAPTTKPETCRSLRDLGSDAQALDQQNLVSNTAETLQTEAA